VAPSSPIGFYDWSDRTRDYHRDSKLKNIAATQTSISHFYSALRVAAQELEGKVQESGFSLAGANRAIVTLSYKYETFSSPVSEHSSLATHRMTLKALMTLAHSRSGWQREVAPLAFWESAALIWHLQT
jgi:hypothetical protein